MNLTVNQYSNFLGLYLISLIFLYPYGVKLGENAIRIADVFAIVLIVLGLLLLLKIGKVNKNIKALWFVIPFMFLEITLPLIGLLQFPNGSSFSSIRIVLMYLPLIGIFVFYSKAELIKMNYTFEKSLELSLIINVVYSFIQILIVFGYISDKFLLQQYLVEFAVDDHYKVRDGVRASGLFNNAIEFSVYGTMSFCYFFSRLITNQNRDYLFFSIISLVIVVVSTTRAALFAIIVITILNLLFVPVSIKRKAKVLIYLGTISLLGIFFIKNLNGFDEIFFRFTRLGEGLSEDFSYSYRTDILWPYVLENVRSYPLGTLVQPGNVFGVIDSGYLSYYAQGKWLLLTFMAIFLIGIALRCLMTLKTTSLWSWTNIFVLNIIIYIFIAALVYNPLRSPLILFFLLFGLANVYFLNQKKHSKKIKENNNRNNIKEVELSL